MRALSLLSVALLPLLATAQIDLVKNFDVGDFGSNIRDLVPVGDVLFFRSYTASEGLELWKSDGTEVGTVLVKDINPGAAHGLLAEDGMVAAGGVLYFTADDGIHGRELWRSDGTEAGTYLVKDIRPGTTSSGIALLAADGDKVFFRANDGNPSMDKLYASDGTESGTLPRAAAGGQDIFYAWAIPPVLLGDTVYFRGSLTGNNGATIWRTELDSTTARVHANVTADPNSSLQGIGRMVAGAGGFFFAAHDGLTGLEMWWSNGSDTTRMLVDATPGMESPGLFNLDVRENIAYWCVAYGPGRGLWRSDGTVAGTTHVADMTIQAWESGTERTLRQLPDRVLFAGTGDEGSELWTSDGTTAGTALLQDIFPGPNGGISGVGTPFRVIDDILYFAAETPAQGVELWRSDGTVAGTNLVQDRAPGSFHFGPNYMVRMGAHIYLTGETSFSQRGLYRMPAPGTTGLAAHLAGGTLAVYPNPTADLLMVQLPYAQAQHRWEAQLTDVCGRTQPLPLAQPTADRCTLDLASVAQGVYLLTLHTAQGRIHTARVVVER